MKYTTFIILILFLFTACTTINVNLPKDLSTFSLQESLDNSPINLMERNNSSLISQLNLSMNEYKVVTGSMSKQSNAEQAALQNVAEQIAMSKSLYVFTGHSEKNKGRYILSSNDYTFSFDDSLINSILESLSITEVKLLKDDQYLIKIKNSNGDTNSRSTVYSLATPIGNERPSWVNKPPKIEGYITGVGVAMEHSSINKGIVTADLDAAQRIIQQIETIVKSYQYQKDDKKLDKYKNESLILSEGIINDFQIIDRWIDPDKGYIYSLGIGRN